MRTEGVDAEGVNAEGVNTGSSHVTRCSAAGFSHTLNCACWAMYLRAAARKSPFGAALKLIGLELNAA